jgi:hypothetical protein
MRTEVQPKHAVLRNVVRGMCQDVCQVFACATFVTHVEPRDAELKCTVGADVRVPEGRMDHRCQRTRYRLSIHKTLLLSQIHKGSGNLQSEVSQRSLPRMRNQIILSFAQPPEQRRAAPRHGLVTGAAFAY